MDLVDSGRSVAAAPLWTGTTRDGERLLLLRFAGAIAVLHIVGWGLFGYYSRRYPALAGLGTLAYTLGLRHALDADHIAAIDNTARKLLQEGKRPLGVGFFFSLGHSTVVFVLVAAVAVASRSVGSGIASFRSYGSYLGAGISAVFLLAIAAINSVVLLDILRALREMKSASLEEEQLDRRLLQRGLMARFCLRHLARHINSSRRMYPVGILFGLGFDTATEIALLAFAAGAATHHVPILAVISLPLLFAAGMSLLDTADGALMCRAYGWALSNPIRRISYNLTVTSLSIAVALAIGLIELLKIVSLKLALTTGFWAWISGLDLAPFGYTG